jgi:preprotein translocase subunit SecG
MLFDIIVLFHVFLCIGLVGLILIQHGKGADAGAAFGSGASATMFGSQGSGSFLTRVTAILATTFFITSLTLAYFTGQRIEPKSVVEEVQQPVAPTVEVETEVPSVPEEQGNSELPAVPAIDNNKDKSE